MELSLAIPTVLTCTTLVSGAKQIGIGRAAPVNCLDMPRSLTEWVISGKLLNLMLHLPMDGDRKPGSYLAQRVLPHKMKSCENYLNSRLSLVKRLGA